MDVALAADNPWAFASEYQADAVALLEEALAGLDPPDAERRTLLLDRIASNLYYIDPERERRVAYEALDLAERADSPPVLAAAQRAVHLWHTHEPEAGRERLAIARQAHELSCRVGEATGLLLSRRSLLVDLLENGAIDEFECWLDAYELDAQTFGSPHDIYWSTAFRATQATMHGDLDAAEQLARGAMLRGHELDQISDGAFILQRFVIRYEQARLAEEATALQEMGKVRSVYRTGAALHTVALSETGQAAEAVAVTRSILGPDGAHLPRDAFWLAGACLFAGAVASAGDCELAALLQRLLEPCADHVVVFGAGAAMLGTGHQWTGELAMTLGEIDAAIDHFAEAGTAARHLRAPYWIAQSAVSTAAALRTRDCARDREGAAELLEEAASIAEPRRYGRILAQVSRLV